MHPLTFCFSFKYFLPAHFIVPVNISYIEVQAYFILPHASPSDQWLLFLFISFHFTVNQHA